MCRGVGLAEAVGIATSAIFVSEKARCSEIIMKCLPALTDETDRAFWISREDFGRVFDQRDFNCRASKQIEENYSEYWVEEDLQGNLCFRLPVVDVVSGTTQFINGRHRTAVLLRKLPRVPIAFTAGPAQDLAWHKHVDTRNLDPPQLRPRNLDPQLRKTSESVR